MMSKLKSRKLWVAVIGAALVVLLKQLGVDAETGDAGENSELIENLVTLLIAYILGQSGVDIAALLKGRDKP